GLSGIKGKGAPYRLGFGTPAHIGKLFLTDYLFAFEVASLLLLVAAVGAIVLARRRRGLEDDDVAIMRVLSAPRPAYTGTIAEGVGVRRVLEQLEQAHGGVSELLGGVPQDREMTPTIVGTRDVSEPDGSGDSGDPGEGQGR
ncbi:MAG: hypothetical protein KGL16_00120, partial [Acidobacteriota bacterium]|nr:hypothetical protein [Acidobacteriota bacterium]